MRNKNVIKQFTKHGNNITCQEPCFPLNRKELNTSNFEVCISIDHKYKYFRSSVNIFTGNSTQNFPNQYLFLEEEINIHETNSTWFTFGFRQAGRRSVV